MVAPHADGEQLLGALDGPGQQADRLGGGLLAHEADDGVGDGGRGDSPAAAPPTPSATSRSVGPAYPESSLPDRTSPGWERATPEKRSTVLTPSRDPTAVGPSVPGAA